MSSERIESVGRVKKDLPNLMVIPSGEAPPNPAEMLGSSRMAQLLSLISRHVDMVVLDTPPTRNALDFLDAPNRFAAFFESGVFKLFMPTATGLLGRAAGRLVNRVLGAVFGEFASEMSAFLGAFASLFGTLTADFRVIREFLTTDAAAFLPWKPQGRWRPAADTQ